MMITLTEEIKISPEDLAVEFWGMFDSDQALFFSYLAEVSKGGLPMQLQCISENPALTDEGRALMIVIGEYGEISPPAPAMSEEDNNRTRRLRDRYKIHLEYTDDACPLSFDEWLSI